MTDFSTQEGKTLFELEVRNRMEGPARMDRARAEILVAVLLWDGPTSEPTGSDVLLEMANKP